MSRIFDQPGRSPAMATGAMAATSHPLGTATALCVLREGGNAVDAAIAASATLCVVEPHMTGIGGDCFAILGEPDGTIHAINGSGRSAAGAQTQWYLDQGMAAIEGTSPHSVTVPGAVHAWETLHERFGRMDFTRLFADAVKYAGDGYPVHSRVAHDWRKLVPKLAANLGATRHCLIDGNAPGEGDILRAQGLGNALAAIATGGARAFYEGEIAREIALTVQELGGFLSEEDLASVDSEWVEPVRASYHGHEILEIPPNGQGITALILFRLLEDAGLPGNPDSGERFHWQTELGRLAYSVRDAHVADIDHMRASPQELLADEFIGALADQFDPETRNDSISVPDHAPSDTIYLTVVDSDLRCVSFINSVYSGFGSGIVTPTHGIALQNRGSCFVVEPGHPNCIGPSKRPMHTIIPAMALKDGLPALGFGVMGGSYQPMGHAHVIANLLEYGMDPQAALDHPRLFWDGDENLVAESGIGAAAREYLSEHGHSICDGGPHGGGQLIAIDRERGVLVAGSDPRKDGFAAGF